MEKILTASHYFFGMNELKYKKIVVKIGTNVLTHADGLLDITSISQLVDQIAGLKKVGVELIIVSSGSVGAGRSILRMPSQLNKVVRRQVLSSIGQVRLMNTYTNLLSNYQLFCAQVLATKEDFRDRLHYLNMKNCFQALLRDNVVPIVNENDVVAVDELMFTDNDELAGLVASMTGAEALIILSSVDGVLDRSPNLPETKVVAEIDPDDEAFQALIFPSHSAFGRGGMHTKFRVAQKAAKVGIDTFIANGKTPNILIKLLEGQTYGTKFPAKTTISNMKKWIAYNELEKKGVIHINKGAVDMLRDKEKISSLLPVGIVAVEGEFQKGDIISIVDAKHIPIGLGMAQYDAETARQIIGVPGKKALIHYDYLYIDR